MLTNEANVAERKVDWWAELSWQPVAFSGTLCAVYFGSSPETYMGWPIDPYAEYINYAETTRDMEVDYPTMMIWFCVVFLVLCVGGEWFYTYPRFSRKRRLLNAANICFGMAEAVLYTNVFCDIIKLNVGEPRPDFMQQCMGAGFTRDDVEANLAAHDGQLVCPNHSKEIGARRSFPSGHSSGGMCVATYMTLYLFWMMYSRPVFYNWLSIPLKWRRFVPIAKQALYPLVVGPLVFAFSVCVQRIIRFDHHIWDVNGGIILGLLCTVPVFFRVTSFVSSTAAAAHGGFGHTLISCNDVTQAKRCVNAGAGAGWYPQQAGVDSTGE